MNFMSTEGHKVSNSSFAKSVELKTKYFCDFSCFYTSVYTLWFLFKKKGSQKYCIITLQK